jgi:hypothetical protein
MLAHTTKLDQHLTVQQAKVSCVEWDLHRCQAPQNAIKEACRYSLEPGFTLPFGADAVDNLAPSTPKIQHSWNDLGRVLKIGVNHYEASSRGFIHPGSDRKLVAEVTRKVDQFDRSVFDTEITGQLQRSVRASVVHQYDFVSIYAAT